MLLLKNSHGARSIFAFFLHEHQFSIHPSFWQKINKGVGTLWLVFFGFGNSGGGGADYAPAAGWSSGITRRSLNLNISSWRARIRSRASYWGKPILQRFWWYLIHWGRLLCTPWWVSVTSGTKSCGWKMVSAILPFCKFQTPKLGTFQRLIQGFFLNYHVCFWNNFYKNYRNFFKICVIVEDALGFWLH